MQIYINNLLILREWSFYKVLSDQAKPQFSTKMDGVKITYSMTGPEVIATMKKLTDQLADECIKAIENGTKLDVHFAKEVDWNKIYANI